MRTDLLGAILAGGRASRFGADKALALLHGRPLILHVAEALAPQVDAVLVCGRASPLPGIAGVEDRPAAGLGPLGGLAAALHHAAKHDFGAVVSVACDTPRLPADLVARLSAAGGAAYLTDAPVIGLWPVGLAAPLERCLRDGPDRSMRGWARRVGAIPLTLATPLVNVNRRDDLEVLQSRGE